MHLTNIQPCQQCWTFCFPATRGQRFSLDWWILRSFLGFWQIFNGYPPQICWWHLNKYSQMHLTTIFYIQWLCIQMFVENLSNRWRSNYLTYNTCNYSKSKKKMNSCSLSHNLCQKLCATDWNRSLVNEVKGPGLV